MVGGVLGAGGVWWVAWLVLVPVWAPVWAVVPVMGPCGVAPPPLLLRVWRR